MSMRARHTYRRLMHRCRGEGDEAGVALVTFVIALVALLAFTAMAVDLGNIGQTKEHTQTAVQDAVLSAVANLATLCDTCTGTASTQEQDAVNVAENYLIYNYTSLTAADFTSTSCAGEIPATIYTWPTSDCFGFFDPTNSANDATHPTAMAVAIPTRVVNYTFGHAAGLTNQGVSSVAYALLEPAVGRGGFPFSYATGSGTGSTCIKTSNNGNNSPCSGFTTGSGNFGVINSPRYEIFPCTDTMSGQCTSNSTIIQTDMVLGIDHGLNVWPNGPSGSTLYCDQLTSSGACPNYNGSGASTYNWANEVVPQTGGTTADLTPSLFNGGVSAPTSP